MTTAVPHLDRESFSAGGAAAPALQLDGTMARRLSWSLAGEMALLSEKLGAWIYRSYQDKVKQKRRGDGDNKPKSRANAIL